MYIEMLRTLKQLMSNVDLATEEQDCSSEHRNTLPGDALDKIPASHTIYSVQTYFWSFVSSNNSFLWLKV